MTMASSAVRCLRVATVAMGIVLAQMPAAFASEERPTVEEVGRMVTCASCTTDITSDPAPAAERMRAYVRDKVAAGWTRSEILDGLVREYGGDRSILLVAHRGDRGTALVWGVPVAVLALLALAGAATVRTWRRRDGRSTTRFGQ
jgi:cytochrome c-type biogenesis protein CcmH/NrfF